MGRHHLVLAAMLKILYDRSVVINCLCSKLRLNLLSLHNLVIWNQYNLNLCYVILAIFLLSFISVCELITNSIPRWPQELHNILFWPIYYEYVYSSFIIKTNNYWKAIQQIIKLDSIVFVLKPSQCFHGKVCKLKV